MNHLNYHHVHSFSYFTLTEISSNTLFYIQNYHSKKHISR